VGDLTLENTVVSVYGKLIADTVNSELAALPLVPCIPGASEQQWAFNTPYPGYVQNKATTQCLNQIGCGSNAPVIQYACEAPSSTQCTNLEWRVTTLAQLVINVTGQCVTAMPLGNTTDMADCVAPVPATQKWSVTPDGHLQNAGGLCLSGPPVVRYLAVCARISSYAAFSGGAANDGVCLRLIYSGSQSTSWIILEGNIVLASGPLSLRVDGEAGGGWHRLELMVSGKTAMAKIDDIAVGSVPIVNASHGMVSIGSSYDTCFFDNFTIRAA
jgi:hypothetical protein